MPIELSDGTTVQVQAPVLPHIRAAPPNPANVTVLPVAGPPGPPGSAGSGYVRHEQTTPAAVVDIAHNLGRWPGAVTLTSLDGSITYVEYGVQHLDLNTVRISIDTPTAYVALIV